jgi:para-aminobenzoate synthetase component 1
MMTAVQTTAAGAAILPIGSPLDPIDGLRRLARLRYSAAFLSEGPVGERGRYSYVMADPVRLLVSRQGRCVNLAGEAQANPWEALHAEVAGCHQAVQPGLPPFQGGWAGMLGYDLARWLERLPAPIIDEFSPPEMVAGLYDTVLATDRLTGEQWLISTGLGFREPVEARAARAMRRLEFFAGKLRAEPLPWDHSFGQGQRVEPARLRAVPGQPGVFSHFSREEYLGTLSRGIEYIHAGDCFQVNLAQRLLHADRPPLSLLGRIRGKNPVPFGCWLDWGDGQLISASPERFLRLEGGVVSTRPIKGTRPRGASPGADEALRQELVRSPKDRAENIMIVDLLRNDLGRSCVPGSMVVPTVCEIESFPTVHHMVSEVRGRLRPGLGPVDLLAAAFPGGSVTGAPKIRAMEIINELEETRRGAYCGSFFWIGADGSMDSNILIRSITRQGGWLSFPVGGGIVADSEPEDEYAETLHKAKGVIRLLDGE